MRNQYVEAARRLLREAGAVGIESYPGSHTIHIRAVLSGRSILLTAPKSPRDSCLPASVRNYAKTIRQHAADPPK